MSRGASRSFFSALRGQFGNSISLWGHGQDDKVFGLKLGVFNDDNKNTYIK